MNRRPSGATVHTTGGAASPFWGADPRARRGAGTPIPKPGTFPNALAVLRAQTVSTLDGVSLDVAEAHRTAQIALMLAGPRMRPAPIAADTHSGKHREAAEPKPSTSARKAARRNERKAQRAGTPRVHDTRRTHFRGVAGLVDALTDAA